MQAELKLADTAKIARAAQDLAVIANTDSSEAFDRLTTAIQVQQPRLLRQFGIMTTLDQIYGEYARTVGKTADSLSTLEKRQAFVNKILDEAGKFAGAYEAAMNDVGKQQSSLVRLWEEASNVLGQHLIPLLRVVVGLTTDMLRGFAALSPEVQKLISALLAAGAAATTFAALLAGAKFLGIISLIQQFVTWLGTLGAAWKTAGAAVSFYRQVEGPALAGFYAAQIAAGKAAGEITLLSRSVSFLSTLLKGFSWTGWAALAVAAVGGLTGAFVGLQAQGRQTADQLREDYGKVLAVINQIKGAAEATERTRTMAAAAKTAGGTTPEAIESQRQATAAYDKALQSLNKTLVDQANKLGVVIDVNRDLKGSITTVNTALEAQADIIATEIQKAWAATQDEIAGALQELNKLDRQLKAATGTYREAAEAAAIVRRNIMATTDAAEIQTSIWQDLGKLLREWARTAVNAVLDAIDTLIRAFKLLAGEIADFLLTLGPGPWRMLANDLRAMATSVFPGVRVAIHALAEEQEAFNRSLHPEQYADERRELTARIATLKLTAEELKNLSMETLRQKAAEVALTQARVDAARKLGVSVVGATATKEQLAEEKRLREAGAKDLLDFVRNTGADMEALSKKLGIPLNVEGLTTAMSAIIEKLAEYTDKQKKAAKEAAEAAKKHADAVAGFLGVDKGFADNVSALNDALLKAKDDQDLYNDVLNRGAKILQQFNELTVEQQAELSKYGEVVAAGPVVALRAWVQALEDARVRVEAVNQQTAEAVTQMEKERSEETMQFVLETQRERVALHREGAQQILAMEREFNDELIQRYAEPVDAAIHQEERRVQAIEEGIREEIRAREEAIRVKREELEFKRRANIEEANELFRLNILKEQLHIQELRRIRDLQVANGEEATAAKNALAGAEQAYREFYTEQERLRDRNLASIEENYQEQLKALEALEAAGQKLTAAQEEQLRKLRALSQVNIAEIRKQYDQYRQFALKALNDVVSAGVQGFARMLEGAQSFKDVMIGIWQSMKNAFFSFLEEMVKKWIADMLRMAAAKKAAGILEGAFATGIGGGLPGMGAGGVGGGGGGGLGMVGQVGFAGMAGATVGFGVGQATGNFVGGALAGAGAGAAAGLPFAAATGGLSVAIGAAAGFLAGLFGAGKARREAEEARDAYIAAAGGLAALRARADEAGVSLAKVMSANDAGEIKRALEELDKALALRRAKEGLAETYTQLVTLRRQIQLVGGDIQKLYNARTVEEFNAEQQRLNDLLEEQKQRLQGLQAAATGIATRLEGEFRSIQKMMAEIFDEGQIEDFFKAFADARAKGFAGTAADFARTEADRDEFDFDEKDIAKITEMVQRAQELVNRLSLQITATFGAIMQETGDIVLAMNALAPSLDRVIELSEKLGITLPESLKPLLELRQVIKDNEDIAISLSGLTQTLLGLADAGRLNQDLFNTFGQDAVSLFNQLQERGVSTNNIMLLMQPTLQALWEAQKEFGFQTDEATQALLDQAEAAGIVGAQQQDINKKILDVLVIIAQTLGADIPDAYVRAGQAAAQHGQRVRGELEETGRAINRNKDGVTEMKTRYDEFAGLVYSTNVDMEIDKVGMAFDRVDGRIRTATDKMYEFGDAAEEAGRLAEGAMTGVAEGHSPTGIKQIVLRLQEATALTAHLRDTFLAAGDDMERRAGVIVPDLRVPGGVERADAPAQQVVNYYTVDGRSTFTVNGTKATAREEWERLKPEVTQYMDNNTGQFARKMSVTSGRYPRGVGRAVRTPR